MCTYIHTYEHTILTYVHTVLHKMNRRTHTHTHTHTTGPSLPIDSFPQMDRERQRRREARRAAEVQENGREDLGRIEGFNKPSGAGEFDDLISALRSGDVFVVGDLSRSRPRPGRGGGAKGTSAPRRRGHDGRERDPSRTALL